MPTVRGADCVGVSVRVYARVLGRLVGSLARWLLAGSSLAGWAPAYHPARFPVGIRRGTDGSGLSWPWDATPWARARVID